MVIRRAQFEALKALTAAEFESDALALISRHWPDACASMSPDELQRTVREILACASRYEIESRTDVLRFINVAFALGPRFDNDPRYPWVRAILTDPGVDAHARLDKLCEWTRKTLASPADRYA